MLRTTPDVGELPSHPLKRLTALWGNALVLPFLPALYAAVLVALGGDVRPEHILVSVACVALAGFGKRSAALYRELLPFVVTSLGYDAVRYARAQWVSADRVLGCELRDAELSLFSVSPGTTSPAWFSDHHHPALDLLAAVPYAAFVYLALGYAVWLWFRDRPRMRWFLWSFAVANAISFVTWIVLPAAPPWYVHAHGCAIDMATLPSPAGLARVDQLLGIEYFARFYSRAASVFGALPSMHCAYPVLGLLTAWSSNRRLARAAHLAYAAWMAGAAVYLEHHWVLDVVAGWATAAAGVFVARKVVTWEETRAPQMAATTGAP